MNEIEIIVENGRTFVSSRVVAEDFKKEHKNILRDIENLTAQNCAVKELFTENEYENSRGRMYPEYLMTRDGFSLLVMGFTGKEALQWKLKYIEAFNKMEQQLTKPKLTQWDLIMGTIQEVDLHKQQLEKLNDRMDYFEEHIPLFSAECDKVSKAVNKQVVFLCGGAESNAYINKSIRGKVYSYIYSRLRTDFDVKSYKEIKRKDCSLAISTVKQMELPTLLKEVVVTENTQMSLL